MNLRGPRTALAIALSCGGQPACDEAAAPGQDTRPDGTGGHDGDAGPNGPCTPGVAALTLGQDHPFVPVEGDGAAPPVFDILTGGQGAFHIEISLRADGPFDPDAADLEIALTKGSWQLSEFVGRSLLLSTLGGVCSYDKLRLVLTDETGGILGEERLGEIRGATVHLVAKMRSNAASATWDGAVAISHRTLDDGYEDAGADESDAVPVFGTDAGADESDAVPVFGTDAGAR